MCFVVLINKFSCLFTICDGKFSRAYDTCKYIDIDIAYYDFDCDD